MVMRMQQGGVSRSILELARGKAALGSGVSEVMKGTGVDFRNARAEERADQELEALEFRLEDDEAEIGFGVCVARLLFHELNLLHTERSISAKGRFGAQGRGERERGKHIYIPAYVSSPMYVPSRRPAMAVFPAHFAP